MNPYDLLVMLGWADWVSKYITNADGSSFNFGDLVFDTLPCVLQLFLIIFFLNWIMGIIGDVTKTIARGGR